MGQMLDMQCRICSGAEVELFLDLGEQPHCNRLIPPALAHIRERRFPLRAGFCHRCTLVQIDHTIPKEDMFTDYPYVSGTTRTLVTHFRDTAARLVRRYGLGTADLVVDIGSNDGTALRQYQPFGVRTLGVEPAGNVVQLAREAGISTLAAFFNAETAQAIRDEHGLSSLMTAAGVFFHLEELHSVAEGVGILLKPDGVFCVQAIYLGGMIENTAFDQIYHEHLCYYTLRSLEALLTRHGLEVFDVDIVPIHGGSLEIQAGFPGQHSVGSAVQAMRAREETQGYGRIKTYHAFAAQVWRLKDALIELLEAERKAGHTIHCYGAPAKGATLLNSFGIDTSLVALAVEKSPLKFGKLIPGARIPIVDEASVPRPDAYLTLAWNFVDEFMVKERAYLEAGGSFIVPVPRLHVITSDDLKKLDAA